jgi:tripartite-type tricarboxylate transporter receptor subunit TctC
VLEGVHTQLFTKDQATVLSRDLTAVALLAFAPTLYIGPASGAKDLRELIAQAKANPKKINVSLIPGNASALEVMSFLKQQSLDVLVVPYNSMTPVVTAMSRDEAHLYLATVGSAKPLIDAGKIRGLAVFSERRVPMLPDVPTLKELGLAYTVADGINYSIFAPVKTPNAVIRVLNEKVVAVMDSAETRELLGKQGFVTGSPGAEEWQAKFVALARAVERAAKEAGVVPQ